MNLAAMVEYNSSLSVQEALVEHSINSSMIDRNCVVLDSNHKLGNDFELITDDLRFSTGMVRFEYKGWDDVIRRVEGHVCRIIKDSPYAADVKIWTEKNVMISIFLCAVWDINVLQLP